MPLPSLENLFAGAARVVRRFPLTLLCSWVLGGVSIYRQHVSDDDKSGPAWLVPLLSAAGLGLTLTLSVALAGQRYRWPVGLRWLSQTVVVALLALWYGLCPPELDVVWGLRLVLLGVGLHLLVAAVPYLPALRHEADTPGFWRYNETLFLRILTAGLYSGVLYIGCALALLAIEKLFGVELYQHVYGDLFTVLATVFNTWFFLAGVPQDFEALEQEAPYPKGLKLFTQFVLLPLVVLYLAILYAYLARILVLRELPEGWVSTLVLALAVAGIFALLLIHPVRNAAENTWIRTFARWFYRALFPLLILLVVAIGTRIRAYGLTEERYLVLLLAAWLALMATYFLLRRGRGIIWIPVSLALVAFLAASTAFAVAAHSQLGQLVEISQQYKLLRNGQLDGAVRRVPKLPLKAQRRITSIFDFFAEHDAVQRLQPLFHASLNLPDSLLHKPQWRQRQWQQKQLAAASGVRDVSRYGYEDDSTATFRPRSRSIYNLGGGRYWLNDADKDLYSKHADEVMVKLATREGTFRLRTSGRGRQVLLEQQADGQWQPRLKLFPGALADSLAATHGYNFQQPVELRHKDLMLRAATDQISIQLFLQQLTRLQRQDTISYSFGAQALLELRK